MKWTDLSNKGVIYIFIIFFFFFLLFLLLIFYFFILLSFLLCYIFNAKLVITLLNSNFFTGTIDSIEFFPVYIFFLKSYSSFLDESTSSLRSKKKYSYKYESSLNLVNNNLAQQQKMLLQNITMQRQKTKSTNLNLTFLSKKCSV